MNPLQSFRQWRRKPFKNALCRAFSAGVINSEQLHDLSAAFDNLNDRDYLDKKRNKKFYGKIVAAHC